MGIRSDAVSPREAARREKERRKLLARPLVHALPELRSAMVAWSVAGGIAVVLAFVLGRLLYLAPIEYAATGVTLFLPPAAAFAALMLGRRTPTFMLYRLILDRSPAPPPQLTQEPARTTKRRAALFALALGLVLLPGVALWLGLSEAAMGRTRSRIPDHLPEETVVVVGGWLLFSAAAAAQVRVWIARWQGERRAEALCPPLHSGLIGPVYFVAPADDVTPPTPAPASPGAGASRPPASP